MWRARGRRERASLMGTPQSHSSAALAFLEASSGRLGGGVRGRKAVVSQRDPCCDGGDVS